MLRSQRLCAILWLLIEAVAGIEVDWDDPSKFTSPLLQHTYLIQISFPSFDQNCRGDGRLWNDELL